MKVAAVINIYDAERILREYLSAKHGVEVTHLKVTSWNQVVYEVDEDQFVTFGGTRHALREEHSEIFK